MTEDEIRVLNYVDCGFGGPESIIERLRPTYLDLIDRGLIRKVTRYAISDEAGVALRADPLPPLPEQP